MEEVSLERVVQSHNFSVRKVLAQTLLPPITSLLSGIGSRQRDSIHIQGLENLCENDGRPLAGPALWVVKHESWGDFVHLPYLWKRLPDRPTMNAISRSNYFPKVPFLSMLVSIIMRNTLFVEVERVGMMKNISEEKKERLQQKNHARLQRLRNNYHSGIHAIIAPEGTSKSTGRVSPIKSGAYYLSHVPLTAGKIGVVPCIPIGNTYDYFAAEKPLIFFAVGKPFFYEPVPRVSGQSEEEYRGNDSATFSQRVQDVFLDLTTITTTQLAGEYLLAAAQSTMKLYVTKEELGRIVSRRVDLLRSSSHPCFDPDLLDDRKRLQRIAKVYESLQSQGYLSPHGGLRLGRLLHEPISIDVYKKDEQGGNLLRYSVNRLLQVAERSSSVAEVLRCTHFGGR